MLDNLFLMRKIKHYWGNQCKVEARKGESQVWEAAASSLCSCLGSVALPTVAFLPGGCDEILFAEILLAEILVSEILLAEALFSEILLAETLVIHFQQIKHFTQTLPNTYLQNFWKEQFKKKSIIILSSMRVSKFHRLSENGSRSNGWYAWGREDGTTGEDDPKGENVKF